MDSERVGGTHMETALKSTEIMSNRKKRCLKAVV